jgi:WD40 repeat protein
MNPPPAAGFNPFPGLRPFEADDNHLFFGREEQMKALLGRLSRQRFLAVVGTSGGGKSSLVRAGLLPALDGGFMVGAGSAWRVAVMRPGIDPIGHLAAALQGPAAFETVAAGSTEAIDPELASLMTETTLRRGALGLSEAVRLERMERGENLLIVVDQFEELFRFKQESARQGAVDEAEAFVKLVLEASQQTELPIYIVLTMRSEYLGECSQFRDLPEALNDSQVLIPRLTRDQLRQAIEAPVKVGGAAITPSLVNRLLNDIGDNQDQLPVLQHALMRTWEHWQARGQPTEPITLEDYLAIGGMERALSLHADEIYNGLASEAQRSIAETLFRCLTEKDSGGRGIRRPTRVREVGAVAEAAAADVIAIAEAFRAPGRTFLMPPLSEALDENSLFDLSHESLMRIWGKLNNWVEDEAQSAQTYRRLAETAIAHARGEAAPLRDPELTIFGNWQQKQMPNAAWAERYAPGFDEALAFLRFSKNEHEAELAEKERRREEESRRELEEANRARVAAEDRQRLQHRWLMGMGAVCLVAVGSAAYAWTQTEVAKTNQALAYAATAEALLSIDPLGSMVSGLAAMGRLADDPVESIPLSATLTRATTNNWQIGAMETDQDEVASLIELKNGELISGGVDGSLWRWRDGKPLGNPIKTRQGAVWAMIELKNGELISGGSDGSLRRWREGQALGAPIKTGQQSVYSLLTLSNGDMISGGKDGSMRIWRNHKSLGGKVYTGQGALRSLVKLTNGDLISGGGDGSLRRWRNGQPLGDTIKTGQGAVWSLVELKNGELISGGNDGSLQRWRDGKAIGAPIKTGQGMVLSLIERQNGELISAGEDGSLRRWREANAVGATLQTGQGAVWSLTESKTGELLSGGRDGSVRRWREGNGNLAPIPTRQGGVWSLVELKNGELISGGQDGTLVRWHDGKAVGAPIQTRQGAVYSLIEMKNGELISGGLDGTIVRWHDGKAVGKPIQTRQGAVYSLIEMKNGELISGGLDGSLRRWRDGKAVGALIPTGQGAVRTLIELKNGDLISAGKDGSLRRWRNGKPLGEKIKTGQGTVWMWSLVALKNGEMISGGDDGNLRMSRAGRLLGGLIPSHQRKVFSLFKLRSGELVSGGFDGTIQRWLRSDTSTKYACQQIREHPAILNPQTTVEEQASDTCNRLGKVK